MIDALHHGRAASGARRKSAARTACGACGGMTIALAGNPNVGKSTVFNALTGLKQHTGNWAGKTVQNAEGTCCAGGKRLRVLDIPGAYSLLARSREEMVARDCVLFGGADVIVVVCDATCLVRNLNLVLQTLEITPNVVVCVNLLDEAEKRQIRLDLPLLSERLGVPVVGTNARGNEGLDRLLEKVCLVGERAPAAPVVVRYPAALSRAVGKLVSALQPLVSGRLSERFLALRLLEGDDALLDVLETRLNLPLRTLPPVNQALEEARGLLSAHGLVGEALTEAIVSGIYQTAETLLRGVVCTGESRASGRQLRLDRALTGRLVGIPAMLLLLALVFYLTIAGANIPSALLSEVFSRLETLLCAGLAAVRMPPQLIAALTNGMFRTLGWVVSVMLPPMAIFFPLFTLLEDFGYLPRIAFNLDRRFRRCGGCGKQALSMCMGFGCNAAGVVGCRIIDSPRERLIAILTNAFVPCNGRFAPPRQGKDSCFFV